MPDCIEITDIPSRRQAEIRARVAKAEHPDWSVTVTEQPNRKFHLKACPPAAASSGPMAITSAPGAAAGSSEPLINRVQPLLDVIADAESNGNYNAHFGAVNNSNPDFTAATIADVLGWQDRFVAGGSPSSAVGRYQIIKKTLKGLISSLGLSGSEKYDPPTQDMMAVKLLRDRGLDEFLSNSKNEDDFINEIAKEWAGLPTTSGESFYAGDGLNGATVSVGAVRAALKAIRTA
jgi:hypothetical protein